MPESLKQPELEVVAWLVLDASGVEPLCTIYDIRATKHYAERGHKVISLTDHAAAQPRINALLEEVEGLRKSDLAFKLRIARLLAEMHGEEILSESQCARYMRIDLVSWRKLSHSFTVGRSFVEGEEGEFPAEDSETILRAALDFAMSSGRSGSGDGGMG